MTAVSLRISWICLTLLAACASPPTAQSSESDANHSDVDAKTISDSKVLTDLADSDAGCSDGTRACAGTGEALVCHGGAWQSQLCGAGAVCQEGVCVTPGDCAAGAILGCDGFSVEIRCSADGKSSFTKPCPDKQLCAAGQCRTVACTPNIVTCDGPASFKTCSADGQNVGSSTTCPSGKQCVGGKCLNLCESGSKIGTNVGCEYWSVDLDNYPDPTSAFSTPGGKTPDMIAHSIVIANPGSLDANLTFTVDVTCANGAPCQLGAACTDTLACATPATAPYDLAIPQPLVKPGETREFKMPVMNAAGTSALPKGIHVKSDQPIVAWQFNPFDAEGAASNDGSLLLPQNVLGKTYFPVTRPTSKPLLFPGLPPQAGYVTIVAVMPGVTTVTVTPSCLLSPSIAGNVPPMPKGQPTQMQLTQYTVLNLQAKEADSIANDLTGTFVQADKPIAVFGGHQEDYESYSGSGGNTCCAEHIEEQFMPLEQWGKRINCVKTKPRANEPDHWIFVAGDNNVKLTTVPQITGVDGVVLQKRGDHLEVSTTDSFMLSATGKVQATQILVGQGAAGKIGDPSMQIVPSPQHYRTDYGILTAKGYTDNYATVVRPAGAEVTLDGKAIDASEFTAFGDNSYEFAYVDFATGQHTFASTAAFGLQVYGYGSSTAYSYPGGMNLFGAAP